MVFTARQQWTVHEWVLKFLYGKLHEFDEIRGPEGVGQTLHDRRLEKKQVAWKKGLQDTVVAKNPDFNWLTVAGLGADADEVKAAKHVS